MSLVRLLLLFGIGGGLVAFCVQNQQPVVSLVFLNMRTLPLPLALWVLVAIVAGIATTVLVNGLLGIATLAGNQKRYRRPRPLRQPVTERVSYASAPQRESDPVAERVPQPPSATRPNDRRDSYPDSATEELDDWDDMADDWFEDEPSDRRRDEVWEEAEAEEEALPVDRPRPQPPVRETPTRDRSSYEAKQEPKSSSRSGSVYSYSYREPGSTGVGKTESVVDADYRVIVPPYRNLDEDEDLDDERDDRRSDDW
ncbi:MAG: hypothetical protein KME16_06465 [Scytolyngbya sp. HA4215-MV1]|jgi:uncharacterized integral membrane protein|nr:hypothetical protein [Scytolyngbya sp. HA4215-MV1]